MTSRVKRYFLEIKNFSNSVEINLPNQYQIILDEKKDFKLNKFFYKQIGIDHYWRDRLVWSDEEWLKYVANKNLETYVLKKDEEVIGFYEQEHHPVSNEVELINPREDSVNGVCRVTMSEALKSSLKFTLLASSSFSTLSLAL